MQEINFDGLAGPTHHYGGHSFGNIACMQHAKQISNPKEAALQGLKKMKRLKDLGLSQAVLPPPERPSIAFLHSIGFTGTDAEILSKAPPNILQAASSSSAMWRANSATVTPSCDSCDGRVHLTIANLESQLHRRIEVSETYRLFQFLFADSKTFAVHPPLPFADEGAANHIRFAPSYDHKGTHLYVYGRSIFKQEPLRFPARQTREASEAIARIHGGTAIFAKQNPALIEKGVFHNDVIACGNRDVLLYHEDAFENTDEVLAQIDRFCPLKKIKIDISAEEAIKTYLFNSQLLTLPDGSQLLFAPEECRSLSLDWLPFPIEYIDIRESMQNGGGPACLRLAIPLTKEEKEQNPRSYLPYKQPLRLPYKMG